ncbi:MAG: hypothetical protein GY753_11915 [Gammaproteobacteria bacterium]|nr:hypothetical protein [Gammaproteobacteria bacterium]
MQTTNPERQSALSNILASLAFMHPDIGPDHVVELAVQGCAGKSPLWDGFKKGDRGLVSGWYSNAGALANKAVDLGEGWPDYQTGETLKPSSIYVTMNAVSPDLLGLSDNRILVQKNRTKDEHVSLYTNIFIDIDPKRLAGISSTEAEKQAAQIIVEQVKAFGKDELGWPDPMYADSGNGYHLVYKSFFNNNLENAKLLSELLSRLNRKFCTEPVFIDSKQIQINVDTQVFNPARLIKLHGTWARKGEPIPARPHRQSWPMSIPTPEVQQQQGVVSIAQVQSAVDYLTPWAKPEKGEVKKPTYNAVTGQAADMFVATGAPTLPGMAPRLIPQGGKLDLAKYLADNNIKVRRVKLDTPGPGSETHVLHQCVFDETHDRSDAAIILQEDGMLLYKCLHDSCAPDKGRGWKEARAVISGSAKLGRWMEGGSFGIPFPDITEKGLPKPLYSNFAPLIEARGYTIRLNEMKAAIECTLPNNEHAGSPRLNKLAEIRLQDDCVRYGIHASDRKVRGWMEDMAESERYHPIQVWVDSNAWDGIDRFEELAATVTVKPGQELLWRIYLRRWLIGGAAALYKKGFFMKGVLTFTGYQDVGKTSWLASLVPPAFDAFKEGMHLDPTDKHSKKTALTHWITELGEVGSTFRKADIDALKAFLSAKVDKIRPLYANDDQNWDRRTIFAGTVNEADFLVDKTGNSRWWVTEPIHIDYQHQVDMQQVWAQAKFLCMMGEQWHLTQEEKAMQVTQNKMYESISPLEEAIVEMYDFSMPASNWHNLMTATGVLKDCGYTKPSQAEATKCGIILKSLVGSSKHTKLNGIQGKYFALPVKRGSVPQDEMFTQVEGNVVAFDPTKCPVSK